MTHELQTPSWSIQTAPSWQLHEHADHFEIVAPTSDATLRLTTFAHQSGHSDTRQWVDFVAYVNRLKQRRVQQVRLGAFDGYRVEFESIGKWFRGYALCAGSVGLDATYSCPANAAGRDDQTVDGMLDSLICASAAV